MKEKSSSRSAEIKTNLFFWNLPEFLKFFPVQNMFSVASTIEKKTLSSLYAYTAVVELAVGTTVNLWYRKIHCLKTEYQKLFRRNIKCLMNAAIKFFSRISQLEATKWTVLKYVRRSVSWIPQFGNYLIDVM